MELLLFPPKDPAEIRKLKFELAEELGAAQINQGSFNIAISAVWGTDPAAQTILTATSPEFSGTDVYIWVDTGLPGVDYELRLTFQTNENPPRTIVAVARLPVRTAR